MYPHTARGRRPVSTLVSIPIWSIADALSPLRRDHQLALAHGTRLVHCVGANGFFTALIGAARVGCGGAELGEWLNASDAAERVETR